MAGFIMAMVINQEGRKEHRDVSHQVDESLKSFGRHGVKITNLYATLGRYDYLAIFEAPDQTLAFKIASEINSSGVLRTETWPLIPYDEFSQLVG